MSNKDELNAPFMAGTKWEQFYNEDSTRWERGALNPAFVHWQFEGRFAGSGSIIIPGCGRSPEPLALARLGLAVTALDFAPTAIAFQKNVFANTELEAHIEAADVLEWEPAEPVDAIYDQTCLCALTPSVWQGYANQMHRWLKPGGQAFILFMQTGKEGGPPFHCDIEAMHALFDDAHWSWPGEPFFHSEHLTGKFELGCVLTRR